MSHAILNPDGTLRELPDGPIQAGDNTANRLKPYAVPVTDTRPVLTAGTRWVNERLVVTAGDVTITADGVEAIPVPTAADEADAHIASSPFARGLVKVLAVKLSMTPRQVIDAIKANA